MYRPSFSQGFARSKWESAYPNLWDGLVGCWAPSLGPQGSRLLDLSSIKSDASFVNMTGGDNWVTGETGWVLDCDGVDEYLTAPTVGRGLLITSEATISLWVKNDTDNELDGFLNVNPSSDTLNYLIVAYFWTNANNSLLVCTNGGGVGKSAIPATAFDDTQWFHLAITRPSGSVVQPVIYINGKQNSQTNSTTLSGWAGVEMTLGRGVNTSFYSNCKIGDVFLYDRILQTGEIAELARGASPLFLRRRRPRYVPEEEVAGVGQPTMRRWGGVPGLLGAGRIGRSW